MRLNALQVLKTEKMFSILRECGFYPIGRYLFDTQEIELKLALADTGEEITYRTPVTKYLNKGI